MRRRCSLSTALGAARLVAGDGAGAKIDLAKLSIATLIEFVATAMDAALARRAGDLLPRWAIWTEMAATLTELWSRLLLPSDAPAARAAFEEAEALRLQLLDRARTRAAADFLARRVQLGRDAFRRGRPEASPTGRGGVISPSCCGPACPRCRCWRTESSLSGHGRRHCGPSATRSPGSPGCFLSCLTAARWLDTCGQSPRMCRPARSAVGRRWPAL